MVSDSFVHQQLRLVHHLLWVPVDVQKQKVLLEIQVLGQTMLLLLMYSPVPPVVLVKNQSVAFWRTGSATNAKICGWLPKKLLLGRIYRLFFCGSMYSSRSKLTKEVGHKNVWEVQLIVTYLYSSNVCLVEFKNNGCTYCAAPDLDDIN